MELTRSLVEAEASAYGETQPLSAVEREHVEMLPETFRGDEFGWRDVEWVVQWFFRRFLGGYPDADRRATESAFRDNDFEDVLDALDGVAEADDASARLDHLTALSGVDVPVASAFLQFMFPDRHVVVDERTWGVLRAAGDLDAPYPSDPGVDEYLTFDATCRDLQSRFEVDAWTLYRALWRLGAEDADGGAR
jgi:hypothetical protein